MFPEASQLAWPACFAVTLLHLLLAQVLLRLHLLLLCLLAVKGDLLGLCLMLLIRVGWSVMLPPLRCCLLLLLMQPVMMLAAQSGPALLLLESCR